MKDTQSGVDSKSAAFGGRGGKGGGGMASHPKPSANSSTSKMSGVDKKSGASY